MLFRSSVALDGDTAIVASSQHAVNGAATAGAAYAMVRTGTTWCLQTRFFARDPAPADRFGWSVAVSGMRAIVGAPRKAGPVPFGNPNEGQAYTYEVDRNLLANGELCTCAGECASGLCVDSVCCNEIGRAHV